VSYASARLGDAADYIPWELVPQALQPDDPNVAGTGVSASTTGAGAAACAAAGGSWNGGQCEAESVAEGTGTRVSESSSSSGGWAPQTLSAKAKTVAPWVVGALGVVGLTLLWFMVRKP